MLLILNINPMYEYRRHVEEREAEFRLMSQFHIDVNGKIDQIGVMNNDSEMKLMEAANGGVPIQDQFLISMFKSMGLSDRTLLEVEHDLREQTRLSLEAKTPSKEGKDK
jgi:hypothetical protein